MRIIYCNLKEGKVKIKPENLDDLWYLKSIIREGDLVSGKSYRRIKDEEKLRSDKGVRVPVYLTIRAENVEFAKYISRLRITGKIVEGPEDLVSFGSYHTIEVQPNEVLTISKDSWNNWELDRLKEAEQATAAPIVLIVCIEEGEAEIALLRGYGVDFLARVTSNVSGKLDIDAHEATASQFYSEVTKKILEVIKKEKIDSIIICGPGFSKDNILGFIKEKYPEVANKCTIESTGSGGRVGVQEILKRGVVEKIVKENRVSKEAREVERIFTEIGRDSGLAAYGINEVKKALDYGAVAKLLMSDLFLRRCNETDELIEKAKKARGEIIIVSTEHDAGNMLEGIGGIAALLRFKVG